MEIQIGYDPNEALAYDIFEHSLRRHSSIPLDIFPIKLDECRKQGLFWRKFDRQDGKIYDLISQAPCATEFSITRFLAPHLSHSRWVLFCDCDMLCLTDVAELFRMADDSYAVMVTKHVHLVTDGSVKMGDQVQTSYSRKNWSSMMLFNTAHPSNAGLTLELINTAPGRDLHNFCWLEASEIGDLPLSWNHLIGYTPPVSGDGMPYPQYEYPEVNIAHFTSGIPTISGYEHCEFADEWREEQRLLHETC